MNLKKRVPEQEQEMANEKEVTKYFLAHKRLKNMWWDLYDIISRNIIKYISVKKGKVLDVGCGYGGLMKGLSYHRKNLSFVGIDLSKAMINVGKKYISNKKIKFSLMSADNIKFEDESFDLVICKDTFHHLNNPVKVLKEMYRVLKKGGQIYAIDLRRNAPEATIYQIVQMASELNIENAILYIDSIEASYTILEMRKMLKRVGIKKYKIFNSSPGRDFIKNYKINPKYYRSASNYLKDKWILVVRK